MNIEKLAIEHCNYKGFSEGKLEQVGFSINQLEAFAKALQSSEPVVIKAKKIEWEHERDNWYDSYFGLHIYIDQEEPEKRYVAVWGENEQENFATFEEAEDWCQNQIDAYVRKVATVDVDTKVKNQTLIDAEKEVISASFEFIKLMARDCAPISLAKKKNFGRLLAAVTILNQVRANTEFIHPPASVPLDKYNRVMKQRDNAIKALADLSFECFAGIGVTEPSIKTYNETFNVLDTLRKAIAEAEVK